MATGIVKRHSRQCRSRDGGRCSCRPSYQAWISRKEKGSHRKIRKSFRGEGAFAAAKAWRDDASMRKRDGSLREPTKATLREEGAEWLASARAGEIRLKSGRRYKPSTLRSYEHALRDYIGKSDIAYMKLTEIRRPDVQAFCDMLVASGLSGSTVRNILNPLQAIYRRALARDLVVSNPTTGIELPKDDGKRDRIASPEEAERLLAALTEDRALWATAFYAGLRRGELCALRWSDVDLGASEIHVRRAWDQYEGELDPKSDAGRRVIPLLAALRDFLDEHKLVSGRGGDDLVFGRSASEPFVASTIRNRAIAAWDAANLARLRAQAEALGAAVDDQASREEVEAAIAVADPGAKALALLDPITLHECRHTFASMLIHAGVNPKAIQEFMGHSTIEMTFDRYGHLMPGSRDEARVRVDAFLAAACAPNAGQTPPRQRVSQGVSGG